MVINSLTHLSEFISIINIPPAGDSYAHCFLIEEPENTRVYSLSSYPSPSWIYNLQKKNQIYMKKTAKL